MYEHQYGFPSIIGARCAPVTHLHPSPHSHLPDLAGLHQQHQPAPANYMRAHYLGPPVESSARLGGVSSGLEDFMFTVYLTAIISLDDAEVQDMFGEPEIQIVRTSHLAAQQSLINAGLMQSDITDNQAYILYLVCTPHFLASRRRLTPAGRLPPVHRPPPDLLSPGYRRLRRATHGAPQRSRTL